MNKDKMTKEEQALRKKLKKLFPDVRKDTVLEKSSELKTIQKDSNTTKKTATSRPKKVPERNLNTTSAKKPLKMEGRQKNQTKKNSNKRTMVNDEKAVPNKKKKTNNKNKQSSKKKNKVKNVTNTVQKKNVKESQWMSESSSDEEYTFNSEEENRNCIIDDYLDEEMQNSDYLFEDEEEEEEEEEDENYSFSEDYSYDDESCYYDSNSDAESVHIPSAEDDLIIHQGTASTRPITATDGLVQFDSDNEGPQIIELDSSNNVKVIKQSAACDREVLTKLSSIESDFKKIVNVHEDTDDCPQLVCRENASISSYDEFSDCFSGEEDLIAKYNAMFDRQARNCKKFRMQAHVLSAVGKSENSLPIVENTEEDKLLEDIIAKTQHNEQATILSARVIEEAEVAEQGIEQIEVTPMNNLNSDKFEQPNSADKLMDSHFFKAFNSLFVLAIVKNPIYLYGTLRFKLIAGEVDVYGLNARLNQEYEIFSPRGCTTVCLKAISNNQQDVAKNLMDILREHDLLFDPDTLKVIEAKYNPKQDALVLLRRNEEREPMILQYKKYMNENVFPNLKMLQPKTKLQEHELFLNCHLNAKSVHELQMPQDWQDLTLTNDSRFMLCGGKAVGKSTLLRILLNKHISNGYRLNQTNAVLLIDLDIGQPEIGVHQTVSCTLMTRPLLGPGLFLDKPTDFSYFVGEINAALCALRYVEAVELLIKKCQATVEYKNIPWIINTMGYNQGIGTELIAKICDLVQPTDVVQIESNVAINNFPMRLDPTTLRDVLCDVDNKSVLELKPAANDNESFNYRLHVVKTAVDRNSRYQREWYMSAKDMRYVGLIAHLSSVFLRDSTPLCAELSLVKIISASNPEKTSKELQPALTCNVVYLCHQEADSNQIPMPCFGIGVVRSVDEEHIYIMPAANSNMSYVNCIVISEQPLPTANLKSQGTLLKNTNLPFMYVTEGNASTAVKQIYHRPAHFLSGKHRELIA